MTYDLAIAKPALCIQIMESPRFDNLLIQLGPFHIVMSYFKAIGKFICESGLPHILTESGVLAQGSLRGFLNGTNFNRSKRIHPMLAVALSILHFRSFMKKEQARVDTDVPAIDDQTLYRLLMSIEVDAPANEDDFIKSLPLELVELFEKYQNYKKVTLE